MRIPAACLAPDLLPLAVVSRVRWVQPTGSRYCCQPPPLTSDLDLLVLVIGPSFYDDVFCILLASGYEPEGGEHYRREDGTFASLRRADPGSGTTVNLLLTADEDFANRHERASECARLLNLTSRETRVALFRDYLYDESTSQTRVLRIRGEGGGLRI